MKTNRHKSVSGTQTLPEFERRRGAPDFRGELERAVLRAWADMNIRNRVIDDGHVPVDHLVPLVQRSDGTSILDPTALAAVNTTIQWLFGTNVGRACASELFKLEESVFAERRERIKRIPRNKRTIADSV